MECGFTLKRVRDMIIAYKQMHRTGKYSQHSSITWPVWLNGLVFVYELNGCGFGSCCSHLIHWFSWKELEIFCARFYRKWLKFLSQILTHLVYFDFFFIIFFEKLRPPPPTPPFAYLAPKSITPILVFINKLSFRQF